MKQTIGKYALLGFFFTVLAGSLLHFAFDALGGGSLLAVFVPVNESIWEHIKLLFFPALLYGVICYFLYGRSLPGFIPCRIYGILTGCFTIVVLYYTYSGILGRNFLAADIGVFVCAAAVASLSDRLHLTAGLFSSERQTVLSVILAAALFILFIFFTFSPPMLALFRDPLTADFGIPV